MDNSYLLRLSPKQAIVAMLNFENGTNFSATDFDLGPPTSLGGTLTQVRLTVREPRQSGDDLPRAGYVDFRYNRMEIDKHFGDVVGAYRPRLPTSTQEVLNEIRRLTQQEFHPEDFHLHYIDRANANPYTLQARAESWRWVGEVTVVLADFIDLGRYLADATPAVFTNLDANILPQLRSSRINTPTVNGTPHRDLIKRLEVGMVNAPEIRELVEKTHPYPGRTLAEGSPWVSIPNTPHEFNLHNARVVAVREPVSPETANPLHPGLTHCVRIELADNSVKTREDRMLVIPYRPDTELDTDFHLYTRFRRLAARAVSDGSAHGRALNQIPAGHVFISAPANGYLLSGPEPWTATHTGFNRTNLYNGVVTWNGTRRPQDLPPVDTSLNRVMVVAIEPERNSAYRGSLLFYYRSPLTIDEGFTLSWVDTAIHHPLSPQGGVGPYRVTLVGGNLPTGLSLSETGVLNGQPTTPGLYQPLVEVQDLGDPTVIVRFQLRMTIQVLALSLTGNPPQGQVGVSYAFQPTVSGGGGLRTFRRFSGTLPPGLVLESTTGLITGTPTATGTYALVLEVEDSFQNRIQTPFTIRIQ